MTNNFAYITAMRLFKLNTLIQVVPPNCLNLSLRKGFQPLSGHVYKYPVGG